MENIEKLATSARLIIVRELASGPKRFSQLRLAYYGEVRAKATKSTRSFYVKLDRGIEEGLVVKTVLGYELGELGKQLLAYATEKQMDLSTVKSEAQAQWELKA
jgi:hypothetical protein